MGEQNVAHPFGWRNDRWLHNVQNVTEGDVYEPIGDTPNSLNRNRRRMTRSIAADVRIEGRSIIKVYYFLGDGFWIFNLEMYYHTVLDLDTSWT